MSTEAYGTFAYGNKVEKIETYTVGTSELTTDVDGATICIQNDSDVAIVYYGIESGTSDKKWKLKPGEVHGPIAISKLYLQASAQSTKVKIMYVGLRS